MATLQTASGIVTKNDTFRRTVFVSTRQRDATRFPSAARFDIDLPTTIKYVYGVRVRNYRYTPEPLINLNNRAFGISANAGATTATLTLDTGDYGNDINTLVTAVNALLNTYNVQFTVSETTQRVTLGFTGAFVTSYINIAYCRLLQILGYTTGITLYRTGQAPSPIPSGFTGYNTTAPAPAAYTEINDSDLVLRLTDLEAIVSSDAVTDRATAILMSSRDAKTVVEGCNDYYTLSQVQSRIQKLRVSMLNANGDLYDLGSAPAVFMIEFYCYREGFWMEPMMGGGANPASTALTSSAPGGAPEGSGSGAFGRMAPGDSAISDRPGSALFGAGLSPTAAVGPAGPVGAWSA